MTIPNPTIRVDFEPTNPGQFYACCGLLELADRLWPGAEGWFEERTFCIVCGGHLGDLLGGLAKAQINSSLTDQELKRLGTLLSANKLNLSPSEVEEKQRLGELWRRERLHLSDPFGLWLDWWWDEYSGAKALKTWAAKQLVLDIARPLLRALGGLTWDDEHFASCLSRTAEVAGLPFYFDSDNNSQNTPRDTGFGLYTLRNEVKTQSRTRPLLELGAFFGIQRFRPMIDAKEKRPQFALWRLPLPVSVAAIAAAGMLGASPGDLYAFRMLKRTEYMKAFLPAQPFRGA